MKIEIRSLLGSSGESEPLVLEASDRLFLEDFASYHFPEPLTFAGDITAENGGILRLRGSLRLVWEASCDRCLKPLRREEKIPVDEQIFPAGYYADSSHHMHYGGEGIAEEEEDNLDPEELPTHDGRYFSPDKLFADLVLLYLPIAVYCSENCQGLCPQCGRPKGDPACHCAEKAEKVPGPFDKLADLL